MAIDTVYIPGLGNLLAQITPGFTPHYSFSSTDGSTLNYETLNDQLLVVESDITLSTINQRDSTIMRIALLQNPVGGWNVALDPTWVLDPDNPPQISTSPKTISVVEATLSNGVTTAAAGAPYVPDYTFYLPLAGGTMTGALIQTNTGIRILAATSQFLTTYQPTAVITADRLVAEKFPDHDFTFDWSNVSQTVSTSQVVVKDAAAVLMKQDSRPLMAQSIGNKTFTVTADFPKTSNTNPATITNMSFGSLKGPGTTGSITNVGLFIFEASFYATCNASGGVKFSVDSSGAPSSVFYSVVGIDATTGAALFAGTATAKDTAIGYTGASTAILVTIRGRMLFTQDGNITFKFSQNTSNGSASTVKVGSWARVQEVAA